MAGMSTLLKVRSGSGSQIQDIGCHGPGGGASEGRGRGSSRPGGAECGESKGTDATQGGKSEDFGYEEAGGGRPVEEELLFSDGKDLGTIKYLWENSYRGRG